MLIILLSAVIPALVLLYFIYRKDEYQREPPSEILKGFGYGALSAMASFALSIPLGEFGFYPDEILSAGDAIRTAFFGAAIPEELAKYFFLGILLEKSKYFDEYVDGMVYAVCIGMGFAALENIFYLLGNISNWVAVSSVRGLISVPAHFFFAVTMGYFYSLAKFGNPAQKGWYIALAICVPILLHGAFDSLLMASEVIQYSASALALFLGLYIYMASSSKKKFHEHLALDDSIRRAREDEALAEAELQEGTIIETPDTEDDGTSEA